MSKAINPLKINVGFIVKAAVGYQRRFEFDLPELFLPPDIQLSDLRGSAEFGRTPQGLVAEIAISARTPSECARCLDAIELGIATEFTELYAFDERSMTDSQLLLPKNHQVDLAPLIREYLILDMPINPLCKADCKGLCTVCGINRNHEDCEHQPPIDPRLASLKDLIDPED